MKLKKVAAEVFKDKDIKTQSIGFYTEDENGTPNKIYPDFADEILETHGNKEVEYYEYSEQHQCLIVVLKGGRKNG